jgi:hypothetical protein
MAYIKATLVGIVTFFLATIGYVVCAIALFTRSYEPPSGVEVGFDLRMLAASPLYWLIAIAAFALGFYWQFRRTTRLTV